MVEDRIGYRYAKSVFELAKEMDKLEEVREDMTAIKKTISDSRELQSFLGSPLISPMKKRSTLNLIFNKKFRTEISEKLMDLVASKSREQYLSKVAESFLALYDQEKNIYHGVVISAAELGKKELTAIQKWAENETGGTFDLQTQVDPSLIGGYILKIGDSLYDASVSGALKKLKRELVAH